MQQLFYTMPQVAQLVGQRYSRVRWAILSRVVDPVQEYGKRHRVRLFAESQIEELKKHFSQEAAR